MRLTLFFIVLIFLAACDAEPGPAAQRVEPSLTTQIENVRTGQATEIRLNAKFSREHVADVAILHHLIRLNLNETDLTDEDVKQLAALPKLETLRFGSPLVSDVAFSHLASSTTLRHLLLIDTPITDAGLRHLGNIATLESLYLTNTRVTDAGLSALLQRRPTLHVH